jgi:hypothetical protein
MATIAVHDIWGSEFACFKSLFACISRALTANISFPVANVVLPPFENIRCFSFVK